ncbi:hypothetical protein [Aureibacter tunicatorum]|uniref:Uncharacterized protein n=1 Tax=Aureibacter tunicatorum TaxID=866807 RepID=A0AAE3XQQ6_9BACT|nr:hypothetical protein [Aureibacter tunicatorum]MDR6240862.1 hypothetical protein [Aureibacter tunicatorum]BDD06804.1 hypothetical protein AUTU_42870 [Aureibacter tunicatorum]
MRKDAVSYEIGKFESLMVSLRYLDLAKEDFDKGGLLFQAKRVKKAYKLVKEDLRLLMYRCDKRYLEDIAYFLFHVEDWFAVYNKFTFGKNLLDPVKLNLMEGMREYPEEWIRKIKEEFDAPNWNHEEVKW